MDLQAHPIPDIRRAPQVGQITPSRASFRDKPRSSLNEYLGQKREAVESLQEIEGDLDPRGGKPGYEAMPFFPHNIRYTAHRVARRRGASARGARGGGAVVSPICSSVRSRWRAACGTRPATQ